MRIRTSDLDDFQNVMVDYCNNLLFGVADNLLQRLQSVQNAAARMMTRTGTQEHITPVVHLLHWLPVQQRSNFELAVSVYKALGTQSASTVLPDDSQLVTDVITSSLTSAVQRTRRSLGDRSFSAAVSRMHLSSCTATSSV